MKCVVTARHLFLKVNQHSKVEKISSSSTSAASVRLFGKVTRQILGLATKYGKQAITY